MRHKNLLPLAILAAITLLATANAAEFTIVAPRAKVAPLCIAPDATDSIRSNAAEFAGIIERMCGQRPDITTQLPDGRAIVLGTASQFPDTPRVAELDGMNPEGFLLLTSPQRLFIVGNSDLAVQDGIFTLLHRLGCRWFFPDEVWTVIPKTDEIKIDHDDPDGPDYSYRRIWYGWGPRTDKLAADYTAWLRHNRQLGWFGINCGHAYENFCPHSLAQEHPEYFAQVDGKRPGNQICTTNPDVIRMARQYALNAFEKNPSLNMVSMEPNDGGGYCECENCKAVGTVSDAIFLFANRVGEAVAARFPDKYVGLYAYYLHTEPPSLKLHPNVYVQLTTGFRHTKMTFEEEIAAWSEKASSLGIYDYFSVFPWDWDMPGKAKAGDLDYLRKNIPFYHSLNATTFDAESSCNWGPNGLGYYLAAQLMWDVDADADWLIYDFFSSAFEDAAQPVRRFYERWQQKNEVSERTLALSYRDLEEATKATTDPGVQARLDQLKMYLHFLRLKREYDLATKPDDIIQKGSELIIFSRRIMDTGLIHTYPMLFSTWFDNPFKKLTSLETVKPEMVEGWKTGRTDIPSHAEMDTLFEQGLEAYSDIFAADVSQVTWSHDLVPLSIPASHPLLNLLGNLEESPFYCESGTYFFPAKAGETLSLPFIPYPQHTLDVHWTLSDASTGRTVSEGDIKKQRDESAELALTIPRDGLYRLNPGTDYWKAGRLAFPRRPLVVEASRESTFTLWLPKIEEPLYFFVPAGTQSFVLRLNWAGTSSTDIRIYAPDGTPIVDQKDLPSGWDISVKVPPGADGNIWALSVRSLRANLQLLGIPPFLARYPDELMTPREAVGR